LKVALKARVVSKNLNPGDQCKQCIEESQGGHQEMAFEIVEKGGCQGGTQFCGSQYQDDVILFHQKSEHRICLDGSSKKGDSMKRGQPV